MRRGHAKITEIKRNVFSFLDMTGIRVLRHITNAPKLVATGEPVSAIDRTEAIGFLEDWLGLSAVQKRALEALINEINIVSVYVESSVHGLSERFQSIAATTRQQSTTVSELAAYIHEVQYDGKMVPLSEIAGNLGNIETNAGINALMQSLVDHNKTLGTVLQKTAARAKTIADDASVRLSASVPGSHRAAT
jgi:methyl-accepting chemotaxis protein